MIYLVATPIGNLGDISQRALEVLRTADLIASEDTRHTGQMLKRFGIETPQMSFHEHNERVAAERIVSAAREGKTIAVVSDAGTPGISDPAFTLMRRAIDDGVEISMVPGPAAFVMALVLSGLPSHAFTFRGFPPRKPGARRRFIAVDMDSPHTLIFYESPFRVQALIQDAIAVLGDRRAALANDLTKLFERVDRGRLSDLAAMLAEAPPKGEYVLVIEGAPAHGRSDATDEGEDA